MRGRVAAAIAGASAINAGQLPALFDMDVTEVVSQVTNPVSIGLGVTHSDLIVIDGRQQLIRQLDLMIVHSVFSS